MREHLDSCTVNANGLCDCGAIGRVPLETRDAALEAALEALVANPYAVAPTVAGSTASKALAAEIRTLREQVERLTPPEGTSARDYWRAWREATGTICALREAVADLEATVERLRRERDEARNVANQDLARAENCEVWCAALEAAMDPKKLAGDIVQSLADSEPDDDSIEGMDLLQGTPQESMHVVHGHVIERHAEVVIANALFDARRAVELEAAEGRVCEDCGDTGWLENRVEGRYPCTCLTETEPWQELQARVAELEAAMERLRGLADKFEALADTARANTRQYDGGGWDMKAEAYEWCAELVREALTETTGGE